MSELFDVLSLVFLLKLPASSLGVDLDFISVALTVTFFAFAISVILPVLFIEGGSGWAIIGMVLLVVGYLAMPDIGEADRTGLLGFYGIGSISYPFDGFIFGYSVVKLWQRRPALLLVAATAVILILYVAIVTQNYYIYVLYFIGVFVVIFKEVWQRYGLDSETSFLVILACVFFVLFTMLGSSISTSDAIQLYKLVKPNEWDLIIPYFIGIVFYHVGYPAGLLAGILVRATLYSR